MGNKNFIKGMPPLDGAGRPKGAVNRSTAQIRAAFQQLVSNNIDRLQSDLEAMEPEKRVSFILKMSEFIIPKLMSTTFENQIELEYRELNSLMQKAPDTVIEALTEKILTLKAN